MAEIADRRKLTAILYADVKGYSKLMGEDESYTVGALKECRKLFAGNIQNYGGRVVNAPGDSILAEFPSVVSAVQCAVEIQTQRDDRNTDRPDNRKMFFRIGVNLGDVIESEDAIYGDGVNIAARIEALAEPGGISISGSVYDQISNKLGLEFENLGEHNVKNIRTPIRIYRVITEIDFSEKFTAEKDRALPLPDKPSIAVLPFNNMSGDSEQEYFSDGITEDIITALSRLSWLFVIARNSSFAYRDASIDVKQISRELGVRYIIEGSVRKAGNRIRVTAQLIDGKKGNHVWAEKYDGEVEDIFDLQDQITQQIVAALLTQIHIYVDENPKIPERHDAATWDLLARGWKLFYELTEESLAKAEKIGRKAVKLSPASSRANYLLASVLIHQVFMGYAFERTGVNSEAFELAKRAVSLNPDDEYAHWTLGIVQNNLGKLDLAIAELKRAIEINPNCSLAHGTLGTYQAHLGEIEESIRNSEIAIRTNPRDPSIFFRYSAIAMAHFKAGRYSDASQWALKAVHRKPSYRFGHAILTTSLVRLNLLEEAKEAVDRYLECIPNETISKIRKDFVFMRYVNASQFEDGLRKAGLPE